MRPCDFVLMCQVFFISPTGLLILRFSPYQLTRTGRLYLPVSPGHSTTPGLLHHLLKYLAIRAKQCPVLHSWLKHDEREYLLVSDTIETSDTW